MKKILPLFLLYPLLFYTSCKPALQGEFLLTDEEKSTVPFYGSEIVQFLWNDSLIELQCMERDNHTNEGLAGINTNDYYIWETDNTFFENEDYKLWYSLDTKTVWYTHDRFGIVWQDKVIDQYAVAGFILPLDTDYLEDNQGFLEQLTIQGKDYRSVFYDLEEIDSSSTGIMKPYAFYYTKEAGLIRLDFQDGSSWELKEIVW